MDKYTCIIIEDEPLALEKTKDFVNKVPFLSLSATFDNALSGLTYLNNNKVDVLFLDINMDELSGIELLESSKINSQVIITTAYQEYAFWIFSFSLAKTYITCRLPEESLKLKKTFFVENGFVIIRCYTTFHSRFSI